MPGIWVILPPWIYALIITWLGRWGASRWFRNPDQLERKRFLLTGIGSTVLVNLLFYSLLPILLLLFTYAMLPFEGPRTGLALGLTAFMFGCIPARLLDSQGQTWDGTLWRLLIDLLRIGGAFTLSAWLILP